MPKKWEEVVASEQFRSFTPEERIRARNLYFNEVVKPQMKNPQETFRAKTLFLRETTNQLKQLEEETQPPSWFEKTGQGIKQQMAYGAMQTVNFAARAFGNEEAAQASGQYLETAGPGADEFITKGVARLGLGAGQTLSAAGASAAPETFMPAFEGYTSRIQQLDQERANEEARGNFKPGLGLDVGEYGPQIAASANAGARTFAGGIKNFVVGSTQAGGTAAAIEFFTPDSSPEADPTSQMQAKFMDAIGAGALATAGNTVILGGAKLLGAAKDFATEGFQNLQRRFSDTAREQAVQEAGANMATGVLKDSQNPDLLRRTLQDRVANPPQPTLQVSNTDTLASLSERYPSIGLNPNMTDEEARAFTSSIKADPTNAELLGEKSLVQLQRQIKQSGDTDILNRAETNRRAAIGAFEQSMADLRDPAKKGAEAIKAFASKSYDEQLRAIDGGLYDLQRVADDLRLELSTAREQIKGFGSDIQADKSAASEKAYNEITNLLDEYRTKKKGLFKAFGIETEKVDVRFGQQEAKELLPDTDPYIVGDLVGVGRNEASYSYGELEGIVKTLNDDISAAFREGRGGLAGDLIKRRDTIQSRMDEALIEQVPMGERKRDEVISFFKDFASKFRKVEDARGRLVTTEMTDFVRRSDQGEQAVSATLGNFVKKGSGGGAKEAFQSYLNTFDTPEQALGPVREYLMADLRKAVTGASNKSQAVRTFVDSTYKDVFDQAPALKQEFLGMADDAIKLEQRLLESESAEKMLNDQLRTANTAANRSRTEAAQSVTGRLAGRETVDRVVDDIFSGRSRNVDTTSLDELVQIADQSPQGREALQRSILENIKNRTTAPLEEGRMGVSGATEMRIRPQQLKDVLKAGPQREALEKVLTPEQMQQLDMSATWAATGEYIEKSVKGLRNESITAETLPAQARRRVQEATRLVASWKAGYGTGLGFDIMQELMRSSVREEAAKRLILDPDFLLSSLNAADRKALEAPIREATEAMRNAILGGALGAGQGVGISIDRAIDRDQDMPNPDVITGDDGQTYVKGDAREDRLTEELGRITGKPSEMADMILTLGGDLGKYLLNTARAESSLRSDVKAKTSSATGLFQITKDTAQGLIRKYGQNLGVNESNWKTPENQIKLAKALTEENRKALKASLRREPSNAELYTAHFLGAGNAKKFLSEVKNNPQGIAANRLKSAADANKPIFYANGKPRTNAEVYGVLKSKVGQA